MPIQLPNQPQAPRASQRAALSYNPTFAPDTYAHANIPVSGGAAEAIGKGLETASQEIQKHVEEADKYSVSMARSHFVRAGIEAETALLKEPDTSKHFEIYEKAMTKARTESLGMVRDKNLANALNFDFEEEFQRGKFAITKTKKVQEDDQHLAAMNENLDRNAQAILDLPVGDPRRKALLEDDATGIDGLVQRGIVSAEYGQKRKRDHAFDIHYGTLSKIADTDPSSAIKYYNETKDAMSLDGRIRAESLIQPVQKAQRVQGAATRGTAAMQPKTTATGAIAFVMSKDIEGGDIVVQDGDGVTKYGINGKANGLSDDEVRALTPDKAAAIYKANYWDAVKADTMPENIRLLAFDAAVNQGVGAAQEMLQASGGDPEKFMQLREERYRATASAKPEKAENLQGWLNRLDRVSAANATTTPSELDAITAIQAGDEPPEDKAEAVKLFQSGLKAQRDAKDNGDKDFLSAVIPQVQQLNGNWSLLPPSVLAEAKQRGVMDKISAYKGASDPTVLMALSTMPSSELAIADLRNYITDLSPEDFQKFAEKQKEMSKAGAANTRDQILKVGKESLLAAGFNPSPNGRDAGAEAKKLLPFLQKAEQAVQAYRDTHGKDPSSDELQKITDRLLLEGNIFTKAGKLIGKKVPAFDLMADQTFTMNISSDVEEAVAKLTKAKGFGEDEAMRREVYTQLRMNGVSDAEIAARYSGE